MGKCDCSVNGVIRADAGELSAVVCTACSCVAIWLGNVILRIRCDEFPDLAARLALLAERFENEDRAFLGLNGTGVTLSFSEKELDDFAELAEALLSNSTFCDSAGVPHSPASPSPSAGAAAVN